jgi:hypothetical protein
MTQSKRESLEELIGELMKEQTYTAKHPQKRQD